MGKAEMMKRSSTLGEEKVLVKSRIEANMDMIRNLTITKDSVCNEITDLEAKKASLSAEVASLEAVKLQKQSRLEELKGSINSVDVDASNELSGLSTNYEQLQAEIDTINKDTSKLVEDEELQMKKIEDINQVIEGLKGEKHELKNQLKAIETNYDTVSANHDSLVEIFDARSKALEEEQHKLSKCEENIKEAKDKLMDLKDNMANVERDIDEVVKAKSVEHEKFRNLLDSNSVENEEKMKAIEIEKSRYQDELSVLEADLATFEIKIKTAKAKRNTDYELVSVKENLKRCLDEKQANVESIKVNLERAIKEHHDLESEVNQLNRKPSKEVDSSSDDGLLMKRQIGKTPSSGRSLAFSSSAGSKRKMSGLLTESSLQVDGKKSHNIEGHSQPKIVASSPPMSSGVKSSTSKLKPASDSISSLAKSSKLSSNSKSIHVGGGSEKKTVRFQDIMDVSSGSDS